MHTTFFLALSLWSGVGRIAFYGIYDGFPAIQMRVHVGLEGMFR